MAQWVLVPLLSLHTVILALPGYHLSAHVKTVYVKLLRNWTFIFCETLYVTWICRPHHVVGEPPGGCMSFPNDFCRQTKLYASHMYSCYSDICICYCDT